MSLEERPRFALRPGYNPLLVSPPPVPGTRLWIIVPGKGVGLRFMESPDPSGLTASITPSLVQKTRGSAVAGEGQRSEQNQRSRGVTGQSRTKWLLFWIELALLLAMLSNVYAEEVTWETVYDPRATKLCVTVLPSMPLRDVYCEIVLVDKQNHVVNKQKLQVTNGNGEILPKDEKTVKSFSFDPKGASISDGSLLFATPILSSPKATEPRFLDGLRKGVLAWRHRSL